MCTRALPMITASMVAFIAGSALATPVEITRFGFNDSPITLNPTTGLGTCTLIGGVSAASSGASATSSSPDGGAAYNTSNYPGQGVGSGTGGFEFQVSTVGYGSITFNFDGRTSATASRNYQVQYSTDAGVSWIPTTTFNPFTNTNWHNGNLVDLSFDPAIANNANARFRVVTVFGPDGVNYEASGATSTYGTQGTFRIDGVIISGEPVASTGPAGVGSASPAAACAGDQTMLAVTVTSGQNPPSVSYTVTADLSAMGGSGTQQFFDDGSNGDQIPGDGVFSFATTAGGAPGLKSLAFTVVDDQSRSATGTISFGVGNCTGNAASTVVVSQVYGGGGSLGSVWDGDFVELFNRSAAAVTLDGWSVQYASAGGVVSGSQVRQLAGTIAPGGYYLVRMSNQTGGNALPAVDAGAEVVVGGGIFMSNTSGKVFLANIGTPVSGCGDAAIMDMVGYGAAASCFEGAGATVDLAGGNPALMRKLNGCQDTNENFNDFEFALDATPRNTASALSPCQTGPHCGTADFNCDGDIGTDSDISGFFACLSGTCPSGPCTNSADFNGDGDIGTDTDIEAFFRVLSGGAC